MGRTVVAEKYLEAEVKTLVGSEAKYGLIVGQNTPGRAIVAHLTRTPPTEATTTESPVNDSWIAKHAKQVIQLLPGGLDIIGLFVVASPDLFKSHEAQLRSALTAVYRALDKLPQLHDSEAEDRLVALLDPRTKKVTCRSLELANLTSSLRPAEWRYQEVRWHCVQSSLFVQATAGVGALATETTLLRQVMTSLEPFLASLADASCLVDGKLVDGDALLSGEDDKKAVGKTFTMDLLCDTTKTPRSEHVQEMVDAIIRIRGRIYCLAYLHTKATVSEASAALRRDARRSLAARCQMHCDSLVEEQPSSGESPDAASVLHEPPRRVLAPLTPAGAQAGAPNTPAGVTPSAQTGPQPLRVSDYLFPGDTPADSLQTLAELFGLKLQPEDVLDTVEVASEERAHSECSSAAEALDEIQETLQQAGGANIGCLHLLLALAIVVVGVLVSSLLLIGPKSPGAE